MLVLHHVLLAIRKVRGLPPLSLQLSCSMQPVAALDILFSGLHRTRGILRGNHASPRFRVILNSRLIGSAGSRVPGRAIFSATPPVMTRIPLSPSYVCVFRLSGRGFRGDILNLRNHFSAPRVCKGPPLDRVASLDFFDMPAQKVSQLDVPTCPFHLVSSPSCVVVFLPLLHRSLSSLPSCGAPSPLCCTVPFPRVLWWPCHLLC